MKLISTFCAGLLSLAAIATASAQVQVKFSQERTLYLQYEPLEVTVTLSNVTDAPISLSTDSNGKSWLSFLVFAQDGTTVNPLKPVDLGQVTLNAKESRQFTVNLLPFYAIRSTGGYSAQAVVSIPGLTPMMTGKLFFTVGKGEKVWSQPIYNMGVQRVYSLIRFLEVNDCNLYLRVEEPDQNLVYTTVRLGKVINFTDPVELFDAEGNFHVVHVIGSNAYCYTKTDALGTIVSQEIRTGVAGLTPPTLAKSSAGEVAFVGGQGKDQKIERSKLSDTQGALMSAGGQ